MSKAARPVMLVGGVPGNSAEEVFRTLAPILGDLAVGFTDGEFGVRRFWIYFVVVNTWAKHPDLEEIRPVVPAGGGLPAFFQRTTTLCNGTVRNRG